MAKPVEIKTKPTNSSVEEFLETLPGSKREDAKTIIKMMEDATHEPPVLWGSSIIGFGNVMFKSPATGREVAWFIMGVAPRKANISLHLMDLKKHESSLEKLGKHKTGMGCVYINKLKDVNLEVLEKIIMDTAGER